MFDGKDNQFHSMSRKLAVLVYCLFAANIGTLSALDVPSPGVISIDVNARDWIAPVNRRAMGVCLMYTPLDGKLAKAFEGALDGTSGRAWCHIVNEPHWNGFMPFVKESGISELMAFSPICSHGESIAKYVSEKDNNLKPGQRPADLAKHLKFLNKTPHEGFPDGYGITDWEVWNEPMFPQNGAWPPEDYARFVLDCSKALKAVDPRVRVGAALHEGDMEWNRRMLRLIASENRDAIDFVITHPYGFGWITGRHKIGEYYARVSTAETVRPSIQKKIKIARDIGDGGWRLAATEWNIHPSGYDPPYGVSTDMVAGINVASMIAMFCEEGVASAHFFELKGVKPGHFHLALQDSDGSLKLNPVGEVFRLLGRHFRGDRIATKYDSPSYEYNDKVKIPVVSALASLDVDNKMSVFLINRHQSDTAKIRISLKDFISLSSELKFITIAPSGGKLEECEVKETQIKMQSPETAPSFTVELPPCSVSVALVSGMKTPEESELLESGMRFIKEWTASDIYLPPKGTADHGLAAGIPAKILADRHNVTGEDGGLINLLETKEISGEAANTPEGAQAVASCSVFSPVPREIRISAGFYCWGLVRLNNSEIITAKENSGSPKPDTHRGKGNLNAGWNQVDVGVASGSKGMGFWLAIENTGDLIMSPKTGKMSWPARWILSASQSAYTNQSKAAAADPGNKVCEVSPVPSVHRMPFISWKLEDIDISSFDGHKASISLTPAYCKGGGDSGSVFIRPVLGKWDEVNLCHDNAPKLGRRIGATARLNDAKWVFSGPEIDSLVKSWIEKPSENFGIAVEINSPIYAGFHSDNNPDKGPKIVFEPVE